MIIPAREAEYSKVDWIPTGISKLDHALGGGFPTKRISEIFGPYSSGKTSLALIAVAQAQQAGYTGLWCDQEWAWEPAYAENIGVDVDSLLLLQEHHAEDALDQLVEYVGGYTDGKKEYPPHPNTFLVIDAVGALLPKQDAQKDTAEKNIGSQASMLAKFLRKITPLLAIHNCALLVINHQFTDIMTGALKSSGGAKLEYHKSISLSLKRKYGVTAKRATDGKVFEVVSEAEIRKNKLAGTLGTKVDLYMEPGKGFLVQGDLFQELLDAGIIRKEANTFFYGKEKLGTQKKAKAWMLEHVEMLKELVNA